MAGYHTPNRALRKRMAAYRQVACPSCGAKPGEVCVTFNSREGVKYTHVTRRNKYRYDLGSMDKPIILHDAQDSGL